MKTTLLDARTVAIVKPLKIDKRTGANGEFEVKSILARIAVDRDYKMTKTENGKTFQEYPTDFWLVKFTGAVAQAFADNCTAVKADGKLISRHLLLNGNFENYQKQITVKQSIQPQVDIGGQVYTLNMDIEVPVTQTNTIFIADSFRFLDKKPESIAPATTVANVTASSVMPVGTVAPSTNNAQVATAVQPAPAQVAPAQAVQASAPAVAQAPTQNVTVAVPPNFNIGEEAPF